MFHHQRKEFTYFRIRISNLRIEFNLPQHSLSSIKNILHSYSLSLKLKWDHKYKNVSTQHLATLESTEQNQQPTFYQWKWPDVFEFEYRTQYAHLLSGHKYADFVVTHVRKRLWNTELCRCRVLLGEILRQSEQRIALHFQEAIIPKEYSFHLCFQCDMVQYFPSLSLSLERFNYSLLGHLEHSKKLHDFLLHKDTQRLMRLSVFNAHHQNYVFRDQILTFEMKSNWTSSLDHFINDYTLTFPSPRLKTSEITVLDLAQSAIFILLFNRNMNVVLAYLIPLVTLVEYAPLNQNSFAYSLKHPDICIPSNLFIHTKMEKCELPRVSVNLPRVCLYFQNDMLSYDENEFHQWIQSLTGVVVAPTVEPKSILTENRVISPDWTPMKQDWVKNCVLREEWYSWFENLRKIHQVE